MRLPVVLAMLALALPAPAVAAGVPDPDAPPDSAPHWLPGEAWVSNHWLPYDETRLYQLLRIKRGDVWQQLRDDRHNLAQLARRRGWQPQRLATALVAPWRGRVPATRLLQLRSRALRTLTQGHMAKHMFFHSLHQFAVPARARRIFGLTRDRYLALRRAELSPIQIGMLYGRSPSHVQAAVIATLRERSRAGVRTRSTPARQARLLLSRQVSQVPRWLQQSRYNGPPQTHHHGPHRGKLVEKPRNYASNPAISADGSRVVYEAYEQRVPLAVSTGEIGVFSAPVSGGPAIGVSSTAAGDPRSAYNAAISASGRFVAFEIAAGNLNFAKRYGRIHVNLHDADTGKLDAVDAPTTKPGYSRSAFNPSLSDDGRRLAFSAVGLDGNTVIWVRDTGTGATDIATPRPQGAPRGDAYGGRLSGDGRWLVFTWVPRNGTASHVYLRDLTTGAMSLVDRASGAGAPGNGFSSHPAVSADGRFVAFSSSARNLGAGERGVHVYVRDVKAGTTALVSAAAGGSAFEPAISADGARISYTSTGGGRSRVLLHDRASGKTAAVTDGKGISFDPSLSGDGTRVAFASNRRDLAPERSPGARSIYVRDFGTGRTVLVSGGPGVP